MLDTSKLRPGPLADFAFMGLRATIGVVFIVHGYSKIGNEGFVGWMGSMGISPEFAFVIALGEIVPGIMLIIGVLSRISASILAVIMMAAMIKVKEFKAFTGDGSYEFDLILLASCLVVIVMGPGRVALANVIRGLPRPIH